MPEDPRQEIWVALGGPVVNVLIAAALFAWLVATGTFEPLEGLSVTGGSFLERLMVVNVSLVLFNLIPAFPMDGGRVLRALLATRMEYTRATQIAAGVGQGIAFLFGFLGLFANPFLLFIALFVWIGAAHESSLVQMRAALGGIPVQRAMITDYRSLSPQDSIRRAVELILAGSQQDFPVVSGQRVEGVLLRGDLLAALTQRGQDAPVAEIMRRDFLVVDSAEMLETAFTRLQACNCHTIPVTHAGRLVGLVTMDNLGEFMLIQAAVGRTRNLQPAAA
jgi:CBS domain-containing protein